MTRPLLYITQLLILRCTKKINPLQKQGGLVYRKNNHFRVPKTVSNDLAELNIHNGNYPWSNDSLRNYSNHHDNQIKSCPSMHTYILGMIYYIFIFHLTYSNIIQCHLTVLSGKEWKWNRINAFSLVYKKERSILASVLRLR